MTRFIYVEPGLKNNMGHYANCCRSVMAEVRGRGISSFILAYDGIEDELRQDLDAMPWLRSFIAHVYDTDPVCGFVRSFEVKSQIFCDDLRRINDFSPDDLVFLYSTNPDELRGAIHWVHSLPIEQRPTVIMQIINTPHLSTQDTPGGLTYEIDDISRNQQLFLYRLAARALTADDQRWIKLATNDLELSKFYESYLDYPVGTLPPPEQAVTSRRDRTGQRPITLSFLGHQSHLKGYEIVPDLVRRLLAERNDVRFLIHNSFPQGAPYHQFALREMAEGDDRLLLNELDVSPEIYRNMLEYSDLMICPYDRNRYHLAASGVTAEALSNAIPLITTAGTYMARLLEEYDMPGAVIDQPGVDRAFDVISAALDRYDELAARAKRVSDHWHEKRGAARLVDTLLAWDQEARQL